MSKFDNPYHGTKLGKQMDLIVKAIAKQYGVSTRSIRYGVNQKFYPNSITIGSKKFGTVYNFLCAFAVNSKNQLQNVYLLNANEVSEQLHIADSKGHCGIVPHDPFYKDEQTIVLFDFVDLEKYKIQF